MIESSTTDVILSDSQVQYHNLTSSNLVNASWLLARGFMPIKNRDILSKLILIILKFSHNGHFLCRLKFKVRMFHSIKQFHAI